MQNPPAGDNRARHGLWRVLVITSDEGLIQSLAKHVDHSIDFRFARRVYDASAIISVFRPAWVAIDQAILENLGVGLFDALASDPRRWGRRFPWLCAKARSDAAFTAGRFSP